MEEQLEPLVHLQKEKGLQVFFVCFFKLHTINILFFFLNSYLVGQEIRDRLYGAFSRKNNNSGVTGRQVGDHSRQKVY